MSFGPIRRKHHGTGVPADHFGKARAGRFGAVDHNGRITALVADGPEPQPAAALAVHHTDVSEGRFDSATATANLPVLEDDPDFATHRAAFAWAGEDGGAWAFIHHNVAEDHSVGSANATVCAAAVAILNANVGSAPWSNDLVDIYRHLAAHLMDHGLERDAIPTLTNLSADQAVALSMWMDECFAAKESGLDFVTDLSVFTPDTTPLEDGSTERSAGARTVERTTPVNSTTDLAAKLAQIRERQASAPATERMTLVASMGGDAELTLDLPVRWDPEAIDEFAIAWDPDTRQPFTPKGAFVPTTDLTAAGADVPQIVDNPGGAWHAVLCVEGLRTDEDPGREIMPGACQIPDLPVSLRLQIHDEGGHYGAVTCGRIDTMERVEMNGYNAIMATGVFGTDEHGQMAQLLVEEQTQRFISIDPRNCDMEIVEIEISTSNYYDEDSEPDVYDWWVRYTNLTIGAATIVATPALQQAVIAMQSMELPQTPIAVATAPPSQVILASGSDALPSRDDFADPGFHVGDPRLVRQADGHYACPLTVEGRRVFGHVAYWGANHTGFPGKSRKPPHSPTYAYFMTGARDIVEGGKVAVGNLTMGCGHASTSLRSPEAAKAHYSTTHVAHYDGGYGAVQMADVAAGEDDFGIWVSGVLCDGVTQDQVTKFESMGMSGDWREIAGKLHLVATLAVPVPGFPIAREDALVASAEIIDLQSVRAGIDEHGVYSLVAAGRVRRQSPDERLAVLEGFVDELMADHNAKKANDLGAKLADLLDVG